MRIFVYISFFFLVPQLYAQSLEVANSYFNQGKFANAVQSYEALLQKNPRNTRAIMGLVKSYRQTAQFNEGITLLKQAYAKYPRQLPFLLELGLTYKESKQEVLAKETFDKVIAGLQEQPNYAGSIGQKFKGYSLLPYAIQSFKKAMENPNINYSLELARLYGELGELDYMFSNYLDYMLERPTYINYVKRFIDEFIEEDPETPANIILRKTLLKKNQITPDILYNEMLSWLFVQQKQYRKAFIQERAIYKLTEEGIPQLLDLGTISKGAKDYETATEIYEFVLENASITSYLITAHRQLLNIKKEQASFKEYTAIENEYKRVLEKYDASTESLDLYLDYAHFLGFKLGKKTEAIGLLKGLSKKPFGAVNVAKILILTGDVLVLDGRFNQALIYYTKAQKKVKNHPLAQKASFKIAKASYYKGDFEWANTQLNVLKESTTQLIANDAMDLSLTIYDNTKDESEISDKALTIFAKAELKTFQEQSDQAIDLYDVILKDYVGTSVEDDALYYQALLWEKKGETNKAIKNLEKLNKFYPLSLLVDDALYQLGRLQEKLGSLEEAKKAYEKIIFNNADSIHFVEARKAYRRLRGDAIIN